MSGEMKKMDNKDLNFVPPDEGAKNFGPSGNPWPDVDPGKKPPFPIGGPIGEKPKDDSPKPTTGSGKGGKGKASSA